MSLLPAATVIGTNVVIDYGTAEAAHAALAVLVAVRDYVASKQRYDKKWHQDNCPERGDYVRWYADRNRAYEVLQQKFDILVRALLATGSEATPEPS